MKKKVLYFSPINVLEGHAGNLVRIRRMLAYFEKNSKHLQVDFLVADHQFNKAEEDEYSKFKKLYPHINLLKIYRRAPKSNLLKYLFHYKLPDFFKKKDLLDFVTIYHKKQFQALYDQNQYDSIVINYANWGNLIHPRMKAHLIIDTHDFITAQLKSNAVLNSGWGDFFEKECAILKQFDEVWTYSIEEKYLFEQFVDQNKVKLMPAAFQEQKLIEIKELIYPILYVASDNPHNVRSVKWYLEKVVPRLGGLVTYIVGDIGSEIGEYENVVKLGRVADISAIYQKSRVSICPMLSGTGIKIKVLEALSYGLPVVTTQRGLDGLINKLGNGCILANSEKDFAEQIKRLTFEEDYYQSMRKQGLEFVQNNYSLAKEEEVLNNSFL